MTFMISLLMMFQFTGLIRGPTCKCIQSIIYFIVSIHRPHTRPDTFSRQVLHANLAFQFTGLIRGPTRCLRFAICRTGCFNSQASYEARLLTSVVGSRRDSVSIHRPHTRPDPLRWQADDTDLVSIHRPHTRPD